MDTRIRLKDIAAKTGLSKVTVSRALRGLANVAPETREKVETAARELGYRRDPITAAFLNARRRVERATRFNVAYVSFFGSDLSRNPVLEDYYAGARSVCERLGYDLAVAACDPSVDPSRFLHILRSRGHLGLLIGPHPIPGVRLSEWDFSGFSAVLLGETVAGPRLPRVTQAFLQQTYRVMNALSERGYQRIGLVVQPSWILRSGHGWIGGFLAFHAEHGAPAQELLLQYHSEKHEAQTFLQWFEKVKPDIVISNNTAELEWLRAAGFRVPQDVGFFCLDNMRSDPTLSSLCPDARRMGEIAGRMLAHQIEHGERGVSENPIRTGCEALFLEGATIRNKAG